MAIRNSKERPPNLHDQAIIRIPKTTRYSAGHTQGRETPTGNWRSQGPDPLKCRPREKTLHDQTPDQAGPNRTVNYGNSRDPQRHCIMTRTAKRTDKIWYLRDKQ